VVDGTLFISLPLPRSQAPEYRVVQQANLFALRGRCVRPGVRPGTQAEGVFPPFVEDAGVSEVEQHGEQIVGLVSIAAPRLAVEHDFWTSKDVPGIPR
jgi:hypothetical protein